MSSSASDLLNIIICLVGLGAGIGSSFRSLRKLRVPTGWILLLGVAFIAAGVAVVAKFPYLSTLVILAGVAATLGFILGGIVSATRHRDFAVIVLTLVCILAVGGAFAANQVNAKSGPQPLPGIANNFPTPTDSGVVSVITPDSTTTHAPTATPKKSSSTTKTSSGGTNNTTTTSSSGSTNTGGSAPATPTPTPKPTATPVPLSVSGASANISSTSAPSGCYVTMQVSGTITTNGAAGSITYTWTHSDGSPVANETISATNGTSSYSVSDTWVIQVSSTSTTYWDQLVVSSPQVARSSQVSENLSC